MDNSGSSGSVLGDSIPPALLDHLLPYWRTRADQLAGLIDAAVADDQKMLDFGHRRITVDQAVLLAEQALETVERLEAQP